MYNKPISPWNLYLMQQLQVREQAAQTPEGKQSIVSSMAPTAGKLAGMYGAKKIGGLLGKKAASEAGLFSATNPELAAEAALSKAGITSGASTSTGSGLLGTLGSAVPLTAAIGGTILGGKAAYDMLQGDKPNLAGRATLGIATGGLSEVANALFGHKSMRERAREHTANLLEQFPEDLKYQNYVKAMREQYNSAPPDTSKPFGGKYSSWDEYKNAGLEAGDLTGVLGNLNTFGSQWANLDFEKQKDITQKLIDANLYDSKKGEVVITNQDLARQILAEALNGNK